MDDTAWPSGGWTGSAGRVVRDFRFAILAVLVIDVLCVIVQEAITLGVVARGQLDATGSNWATLVTAVFTHWDWSALIGNASWLATFTILLIITNVSQSSEERAARARWYGTLLIPVAVGLNLLVVLRGGGGRGASGAVMTGLGIVLGLCFTNTTAGARSLRKETFRERVKHQGRAPVVLAIWELVVSGTVLAWFPLLIAFLPGPMLGFGDPAVNAGVHLAAIVVGAALTLGWYYGAHSKNHRAPTKGP